MIGIPLVLCCPPEAVKKLSDEHRDITSAATFTERVALAQTRWDNRTDNKPFDAIRDRLALMRPGELFCCYCEHHDTNAIDHIWPKSFYPERAFDWWNFLLACYRCNTVHKGAKWAVFDANDNVIEVSAPPSGDAVFIDLRFENPLELIRVDFVDWQLMPRPNLSLRDQRRVEYTVNTVLNLNDSLLCKARHSLFRAYCLDLLAYKKTGDADLARANIIGNLHPTVWYEMKRMSHHPKLRPYFDGIPEVLDW